MCFDMLSRLNNFQSGCSFVLRAMGLNNQKEDFYFETREKRSVWIIMMFEMVS